MIKIQRQRIPAVRELSKELKAIEIKERDKVAALYLHNTEWVVPKALKEYLSDVQSGNIVRPNVSVRADNLELAIKKSNEEEQERREEQREQAQKLTNFLKGQSDFDEQEMLDLLLSHGLEEGLDLIIETDAACASQSGSGKFFGLFDFFFGRNETSAVGQMELPSPPIENPNSTQCDSTTMEEGPEDTPILVAAEAAEQELPESSQVVSSDDVHVVPEGSKAVSKDAQIVSGDVKVVAKDSQVVPEGSKVVSKDSQVVPEGSNVVSKDSQVVSVGMKVVSKDSQLVPEGSRVFPAGSVVAPGDSQIVVPDDSKVVPKDAQVVPDGYKIVPKNQVAAGGAPLNKAPAPPSVGKGSVAPPPPSGNKGTGVPPPPPSGIKGTGAPPPPPSGKSGGIPPPPSGRGGGAPPPPPPAGFTGFKPIRLPGNMKVVRNIDAADESIFKDLPCEFDIASPLEKYQKEEEEVVTVKTEKKVKADAPKDVSWVIGGRQDALFVEMFLKSTGHTCESLVRATVACDRDLVEFAGGLEKCVPSSAALSKISTLSSTEREASTPVRLLVAVSKEPLFISRSNILNRMSELELVPKVDSALKTLSTMVQTFRDSSAFLSFFGLANQFIRVEYKLSKGDGFRFSDFHSLSKKKTLNGMTFFELLYKLAEWQDKKKQSEIEISSWVDDLSILEEASRIDVTQVRSDCLIVVSSYRFLNEKMSSLPPQATESVTSYLNEFPALEGLSDRCDTIISELGALLVYTHDTTKDLKIDTAAITTWIASMKTIRMHYKVIVVQERKKDAEAKLKKERLAAIASAAALKAKAANVQENS